MIESGNGVSKTDSGLKYVNILNIIIAYFWFWLTIFRLIEFELEKIRG